MIPAATTASTRSAADRRAHAPGVGAADRPPRRSRRPNRPAWLEGAALLGVLALCPRAARSQSDLPPQGGASPALAASDPAYADVERLLATGIVPGVVIGQRPFSLREVARIAQLADAGLAELRRTAQDTGLPPELRDRAAARVRRLAWVDGAVGRLRAAAREHEVRGAGPAVRAGGSLGVLVVHSTAPVRPVRLLGLGGNTGAISSAAEYRSGLQVPPGVTGAVEPGAWVGVGPLAVSARGRARLHAGGGGSGAGGGQLTLQSASARLVIGNAVASVGREQLHWGQSLAGGVVLSTTPRAIDQAVLGMVRPARLPWSLAVLGPVRGTLFVADLGPRQYFPHTRLSGYKVSLLPFTSLEVGATILNQWGGEGSPGGSVGEILLDHVPFLTPGGGGRLQLSNKIATFDGRLRLSSRSGLTLYGEVGVDDLDFGRLVSGMRDDGAQVLGLHLPAAGADGRWELAAEARRTGLRFYNHHQFRSGLTVDGALLGDPLGPNAAALGFRAARALRADGATGRIEVAAGIERRGMDRYIMLDAPVRLVKVESHPAEWRDRLALGWSSTSVRGVALRARVAGERISAFGGVAGAPRWGTVSEVETVVHF